MEIAVGHVGYIIYKGIDADRKKQKNNYYFCKISAKYFGGLENMLYLCSTKINKQTMDKNKTMNTEFNEVYEAITNAYNAINEFYINHYALELTSNDDCSTKYNVMKLFEMLSDSKELAHDIAEHFTWDK